MTASKDLFQHHESFKVNAFHRRSFPPEVFHTFLDGLEKKSAGLLHIRSVGQSFEGRPIRLATIGNGKTTILLWSQMHGDESTATMAIADILQFLVQTHADEATHSLLSSLTLYILPILNPDGAARFQRRTAQGIDMNRDALTLCTPEAQILKRLQQELKPQFGFNLHDQELSTVGTTKELSAIALLAPAFDPQKSDNDVRIRAKHLAATFAEAIHHCVPGKVTRYDDTFEPRAFGDTMQKWGTSTVLVESGHALKDPEKQVIRRLNFVGIISSLFSIASGKYESADISLYDNLPLNGKRAYDVIIRNVKIDHGRGKSTQLDVGISYQVDTHSELPPRLVDMGDLHTFVGLKEIDGKGKTIPQSEPRLGMPFEWEKYVTSPA